MNTPTPVGKAAVDLDPRLQRHEDLAEDGGPPPPVGRVAGVTPVGQTVRQQAARQQAGVDPAPTNVPKDTVSLGESSEPASMLRRVRNIAALAIQAISVQRESVAVHPRTLLEICQAFEQLSPAPKSESKSESKSAPVWATREQFDDLLGSILSESAKQLVWLASSAEDPGVLMARMAGGHPHLDIAYTRVSRLDAYPAVDGWVMLFRTDDASI